jgi:hypothetical protein
VRPRTRALRPWPTIRRMPRQLIVELEEDLPPSGRVIAPDGLSGTLTYDQAITGGTGRYDGARGTVRVAQGPSGDRFTFKIRLD